jgi:predicted RNA-binding protein (virulence factor B family)
MRSDGRIDLTLSQPSQEQRDLLSDAIIEHLRQHDGVTRLTDKSAPDDIYRTFGVSKANYKKALGRLYKRQQILIEKHQITLL